LAKENKVAELKGFIKLLVEVIRATQKALAPFMPATSDTIREQLGEGKIKKGNPLFPRIDVKKD
jgi:methionyl-tRNA synthetase